MMKKTMILPVHKSVRNLDQEILKKWRNKWLTKKVIIAVVSICATLGVAAGVYSAMVLPELFIPYDEEKFQIAGKRAENCMQSIWETAMTEQKP